MPSDPKPPVCESAISVSKPANDNGGTGRMRVKVLIPQDLPVTQTEIEVIAALLDDLAGLAANDNEVQPE